jgi:beta-galactosidase
MRWKPGQLENRLRTAAVIAVGLAWWIGLGRAMTGVSFDEDWRFFQGEASGLERTECDDSGWRKLDVPHDWSIEGPFAETNKTGGAGGWLPSGVGWYRKHFTLPSDYSAKRFYIRFDGVMQNSEVWINGVSLGQRPNGYVSFRYDLTPHLKFGDRATNVLAVRADTSAQPASRWYSGAGIYRHVWLEPVHPVHVVPESLFVTTPNIAPTAATMRVQASVTNASARTEAVTVRVLVNSPRRTGIAKSDAIPLTITAGGSVAIDQELTVPQPELWSLEQPALHQVVLQVKRGKEMLHVEIVPFGIRQAEFRADSGFWLNGKNVRLNGVCLHHDGGAFGAAVPLGVWERRLKALRELGCNAIRTAHNPPAPEFLDLCDRMGFLVMDEFFDCWTVGKNPHDYHLYFNEWAKRDAAYTIRRDRNHPSIVLWSIGNEIHDTPKPAVAIPIARGLVEVCHEHDPTRPVTQALFRPNVSGDFTNGLADLLDVVGTNYRDNELLAAQRNRPEWRIVGTEQRHDRQTWLWCRDNPSHAGQFLWVGVDYLGETKNWPRIAYPGGLLDRTGEIKPMAYERQSWWSAKPMVRIVRRVAANDVLPEDPGYGGEERHTQVQFADWTPRKLDAHDENVEVYSNCEEVELFLNDQSLGVKLINTNAAPRNWKVRFVPGTLRAVGRNAGKVVATDELRTAGPATRIVLTADRSRLASGWDEVAYVRATVVDAKGIPVSRARDLITFSLSGPGRVVAVDSADNASIEPFQATARRAYGGVCHAIIKAAGSPGRVAITASAPGLESGVVAIEAGGPIKR